MSPYKMSETTVVSFSGGRTSAYMLRQVLDANDDLDDLIVTFANTGKEHPATLDFVNECSRRWQVPIVWLEYRDDDRGFAIVTYDTASRDGEPFEALIRKRSYLPNPVTRFCTIDLEIRVIHKYLRMIGCSTEETPVDMMTGIRADEPRRVAKIRHRKTTTESKHATMVMPLADACVGVQQIGEFWKAQAFDLELPTINGRTLEATSIVLPVDATGSKNGVQAVASSVSYGKRYTAGLLLNITTTGEDDDGNGPVAQLTPRVTSVQATQLVTLLDKCGDKAKEAFGKIHGTPASVEKAVFDNVLGMLTKSAAQHAATQGVADENSH
ncbi:phosphoadenosine phosphosulfate reductase family protein [Pseudomonas syringae group genomosp. 3]|nr:phosphoadenosine phosphosulfate reductase family protein [Pseudomonas syringae group genomosp. 3]